MGFSEKADLLNRAEKAENRAGRIRSVSSDVNDAATYLKSAIRLSEGAWEGRSADSFRETVQDLINDCNKISEKAISTANTITRLAEYYENKANSLDEESTESGGRF